MKVSIITVCFNSSKTIEDTIHSVMSQSHKDIEYIIVDGCSTDGTTQIIEQYQEHVSTYISERDEGLYDAMNKGIKAATGDLIGILNSDDVFASENSVSNLVQGFSQDVDAVYADLVYVNEENLNKISRLYSSKIFRPKLIRFGIMLPHPTFYIRKKVYEELGGYKLDYRVAADFEFITRCVAGGVIMKRIPKVVVKMREGGISSSGLLWRVHQNFEIVRACRENGISTSIFLVMLKLPYKLFSFLYRGTSRLNK